MDHIDKAYKSLGEFVVSFQWIEGRYRDIGWLILDPGRQQWPPMAFRRDSNRNLINGVTKLFCDLVDRYDMPTSLERRDKMLELQTRFHELRRYRNILLHSTFQEMRIGGEVREILRFNTRPTITENGEVVFEDEPFREEFINAKLSEFADAAFNLSLIYTQLIHWTPFERHPTRNQ